MDVKSPNRFPKIFNEDIEILQSFMDSTTSIIDEMRGLLRTLRQKVVEESSSKITIAQYDELNHKYLKLNDKMIGIKKDSLLLRKRLKSDQKFDKGTTVIARKNNEEVEVLREELSHLSNSVASRLDELKTSQNQQIKKGLDDVANEVKVADELPIEREVVETVVENKIDDKTMKQIMKQLYKNNSDIASLQRQLNEKNKEIEELTQKINTL